MNILYFDTETTGLPKASKPYGDPEQPSITQLGFILEVNGHDAIVVDSLVEPSKWAFVNDKFGRPTVRKIDPIASELTGITEEMCERDGIPTADVMELFIIAAENADLIVCHNVAFDSKLVMFEYARLRPDVSAKTVLCGRPTLCTMLLSTDVCRIGKKDGKVGYKWPKLVEAMEFFFNEGLDGAHSAIVDILATRRVFHKLGELGYLNDRLTELGFDPAAMEWRTDFPEGPKLAEAA